MNACFLTPDIIAESIGVEVGKLWYIANNRESFYRPTRNIVIGKKERQLDVPKPYLKNILKKLYAFLQGIFPPHKSSYGGVKGKSCFSHATIHDGKEFIITRDVTDCYPSIHENFLFEALIGLKFRKDTSSLLSKLFTIHDYLPQGSPSSSYALNLYFYDFDQKMSSIAKQHNACYGRFADDIVISTNGKETVEYLETLIDNELIKLNLEINEKKRLDHGLQIKSRGIPLVHNIAVHREKGLCITKDQKFAALKIGESYVRSARCVAKETLFIVAKKRKSLLGWISHCSQARYGPVKHLKSLLIHGDKNVLRVLRKCKLSCKDNKWWTPKNIEILQKAWERRMHGNEEIIVA